MKKNERLEMLRLCSKVLTGEDYDTLEKYIESLEKKNKLLEEKIKLLEQNSCEKTIELKTSHNGSCDPLAETKNSLIEEVKNRCWISWYTDQEDHRPIHYPPNEKVLGYWCTGHEGDYSILCALVKATTREAALSVLEIDWPEIAREEIRFCNFHGSDFTLSDRFPLSDWMVDRRKS